MTFLPSELITKALNAMDTTIHDLQKLRNILHQTYGDEAWEVKTVDGCITDLQTRWLTLTREYSDFRDKLFNDPTCYYEELGQEPATDKGVIPFQIEDRFRMTIHMNPCSKCGGTVGVMVNPAMGPDGHWAWNVVCDRCGNGMEGVKLEGKEG